MASAMTRIRASTVAILLAAILFVALNVVAGHALRGMRVDLTADGLYTLSQGTKNLLGNLKEPITLRFFYSRKLSERVPGLRIYGQRVQEMLEEYVGRSRGMIKLEIIDPVPFSEDEDRAVQAGIQGIPIDRASGELTYFGLVGVNTTDLEAVIPFFPEDRERFLEYDLTKLIHTLTAAKKPVLGLVGDLPLEYGPGGVMAAMRGQAKPYGVMEQLRESFDVRSLRLDDKPVDDDIEVLLVAHPKDLTPRGRYELDQFLLRRGRAIIYVDPWAENLAMMPGPMGRPDPTAAHNSDLPELFKAWGLELAKDNFVADPERALQVNFEARRVPYPAWQNLDKSAYNRNDILTGDLGGMTIATPGALKTVAAVDGVTVTPLIRSSKGARLVPISDVRMRPDPAKLAATLASGTGGEQYNLAVRVTGTLKTAFPDGPPKAPEKKEDGKKDEPKSTPSKPHLVQSQTPASIVVVADTDMLDDSFWLQEQEMFGRRVQVPFAANAEFLVNAVDNLAGSNDLIGLRGRAGVRRPFTLIEDLKRVAAQKFLARQQELEKSLADTQKKLSDLQSKQAGKGAAAAQLLSAEEQSAIAGFQNEMLRIRKELRAVQHNLNRDIESLTAVLKAINIGLVPLAVAVLALVLAAWRRRRRTVGVVRD